ncbi:HAD hydrolase family protein [Bacillus sp. NPDC077027]|uniref:HAD hydrolase family protein n=1 Tax=Bacillus sp. NPDC077027 TaxID=3390548 RepID=UPI003D050E87
MKFAAFDLDGTLINEKGQLIGDVQGAVKKLRHKGITPLIITGRTYDSFFSLDFDPSFLNLFHHAVLINDGNVTCHHQERTFTVRNILEPSLCQHLVSLLDGKAEFVIEASGKHIASSKSARLKYSMLYMLPRGRIEVGDIRQHSFEHVTKLFVLSADKMDVAKEVSHFNCHVADAHFLNAKVISPKGICKAALLKQHLIEYFGEQNLERVIAFGNGYNDRLLLKQAKCGIAVQDSHPSAIELCDIHLEESIPEFIQKVLLPSQSEHLINERGGIY